MSGVPSDYRKFYPCPNSKKLSPDGGQPEGYVTKMDRGQRFHTILTIKD